MTGKGMTITVQFTPQQSARVQQFADMAGVGVAEFVFDAALAAAAPPPRRKANDRGRVDTLLAKVARLHEYGFHDYQMAVELKCDEETVRRKRKQLGLPSNARRDHMHRSRQVAGGIGHAGY